MMNSNSFALLCMIAFDPTLALLMFELDIRTPIICIQYYHRGLICVHVLLVSTWCALFGDAASEGRVCRGSRC